MQPEKPQEISYFSFFDGVVFAIVTLITWAIPATSIWLFMSSKSFWAPMLLLLAVMGGIYFVVWVHDFPLSSETPSVAEKRATFATKIVISIFYGLTLAGLLIGAKYDPTSTGIVFFGGFLTAVSLREKKKS